MRTECAFCRLGYDLVLSAYLFSENNQRMNQIVYSQLSAATVGGTTRNLLKRFEDTKNGNTDLQSMCEWYDRDVIK